MILASEVWARALIRRVELAGSAATVARRGDTRAGAVLVKTREPRTGGVMLYQQAGRGEAEATWIRPRAFTDEAEIDAYLERAARIDPDLWVIEIEDIDGARFLTEPVERASP